jgi:hypothetical protein
VFIEILTPQGSLFILVVKHLYAVTAEPLCNFPSISPIFACEGKSNVKLKRQA